MQRLDGWKRFVERAGCTCALYLIAVSSALAQQSQEGLTQGGDIVTAPSVARVVFVFLLMAGIALGAAYAVRRYSPKFANALIQRGLLRVIDRTALHGGLRVHLVEADGERILIAEGRAGVSMLRLAGSGEAKKND
jgi:hypothetical protein